MNFEFIEPSSSSTSSSTMNDGRILLSENPAAAAAASSAATVDQNEPIEISKNPLTIEVDASHYAELLALKKYHEQIIKDAKLEIKPMPANLYMKTEPPIFSDSFVQTDIKIEEDGNDYYDTNEIIAEDFVKAELFDHVDVVENRKTAASSAKKFTTKPSETIAAQSTSAEWSREKRKKKRPTKVDQVDQVDQVDRTSKMYECPICNVKIRNRISNLKRHMKMIHSENSKVYDCLHCDFRCHRNMEMRKHLAEHKKLFECVWCKKIFHSCKSMRQHMMCHVRKHESNQLKKYICVYCARCFNKSAECKRHEENHSGIRAHQCNKCENKFFRNKFDLRAHFLRVHSNQAKKPEKSACKVCGKMLSTASNLREHMRVHSDLRPYVCESCGDTFRYIYSYRIHKRIHTGEKPYPCRFCEISFAHESTRRVHELKHKEECPKQCTFCDKRFRSSSTLKAHIQIHTKEWRFTCSQCSQGFARSGDFKRHLERHKNAEKQQ